MVPYNPRVEEQTQTMVSCNQASQSMLESKVQWWWEKAYLYVQTFLPGVYLLINKINEVPKKCICFYTQYLTKYAQPLPANMTNNR